jgi:prefoldin subunit 5
VSSSREIDQLEAEARYYQDRVSLLRARLYGRGLASSARLQELERGLERAEQRLREKRLREKRLSESHRREPH